MRGKDDNKHKRTGSAAMRGILSVICLAAIMGAVALLPGTLEDKRHMDQLSDAKVVLYEGPKSLRDATAEDLESAPENARDFSLLHCTDTQLSVNGQECYVYDTNVNHSRQWSANFMPSQSRTPIAYFDFEGTVELTVTVPDIEIETVKVSPLAYGIAPQIDKEAHTVTFLIDTPDTYTLQFNDSPARAVHIFANALETDIPSADDENVIYIGPGEWDADTIILKDDQTLYLAGGSVVHGTVNGNRAKNVTVCGRGIIDGSTYDGWLGMSAKVPLKFDECMDVTIKDIIVLNPNAWVCQAYDSERGVIDGIKIISSRPNGDGISLQSCKQYEVKNCFVRSWDDSLVVKNYDRNSEDIAFSDIQIWTDFAQSMEVGYETNKGCRQSARISSVTFSNITVLNNFHKPVISVHNGDDAALTDITFSDIVVEREDIGSGDAGDMAYLIDINIMQSSNWSSTPERGTIGNITIERVSVLDGRAVGSRIKGFDAQHAVDGVTIRDLELFGNKITSAEDGGFEVDANTVSNLKFE